MRLISIVLALLLIEPSLANVGGSDLQNFNPTYSGLDYVTVHPSRTLSPGEFNIGTFLAYTTNSLPYSTVSTAPNNQTFTEPNDQLLYSYVNIGVGLLQGWDIGFTAGFVNSQNIEQSNFLFTYGDTGINEFRIFTKTRFFEGNGLGLAALASMDFEQIKNNPFVGDNAGATFNLETIADFEVNENWIWSVNLGFRLRQLGTTIPNTGVTPLSNQFIYSTATAHKMSENSDFIAELFGSAPLEQSVLPTDRETSNLELLLGYKYRGWDQLDIHTGFGTDAYQLIGGNKGLGSPDIRFYVGLSFQHNILGDSQAEEPAYHKFDSTNKPGTSLPEKSAE